MVVRIEEYWALRGALRGFRFRVSHAPKADPNQQQQTKGSGFRVSSLGFRV